MPALDIEELSADYSLDEPFHPDILSVEIQFLCPACRSRLSVEADSCSIAECTWCHSEIEIPPLSSLMGKKSPASRKARPALPPRPLLTQEELEFLTTDTRLS